MENAPTLAVAFAGPHCLASGSLADVVREAKRIVDQGESEPVLIFDAVSSERIELDFRGTEADLLGRLAPPVRRSPGRPRLGVVAREVTLLPRHWEWLTEQPGGASVTLRKLVDQARSATADQDRVRRAKESAYRFIAVMAGDRPGFEEASRALFAGDRPRFETLVAGWPADIAAHAVALMAKVAE